MPNTLTQNAQIIDEAVADIKDEIALKGVTVPDPCPITTIPSLIESISGGGGGQDTQQLINMVERPQNTEIVIPEGATSIASFAFYSFRNLKKILLPAGVTSIGYGAFQGCSSLVELSLPSSITYIGQYAFQGCSSLVELSLPSSLTYIGYGAFQGCSSLVELSLPSSLTSIGPYAFDGCRYLALVDLTDFTDPTAIPTLADKNAFDNVSTNCVFLVANAEMQAAFSSATNWSYFTFTIQGA